MWPFPTRDEINACASKIARNEYDNDDGFIVDNGYRPDFIAKAKAYRKYGRTIYEVYVEKGTKEALRRKLLGRKIEWPIFRLRDGYYVSRWNGSAMLVKEGDPEPLFGMIGSAQKSPGYREVPPRSNGPKGQDETPPLLRDEP